MHLQSHEAIRSTCTTDFPHPDKLFGLGEPQAGANSGRLVLHFISSCHQRLIGDCHDKAHYDPFTMATR
ncbi:MAG: hypothetical protein A4S16_14795 [Proteobacteria bacterium SG_bin6]|nr:MAG: hypothetical protein A4S16_14795 [Proteobacteria bacterium SG_bin6]